MNKKYYTGIGSRKAPDKILKYMEIISKKLNEDGYILRSGGAEGCDTAFENMAGKNKEIFYAEDATEEVIRIAMSMHPAAKYVSEYAKRLHGRNVFQVLGMDLKTPSEFVICYTKDGCEHHLDRSGNTGGTGTALSLASKNNIVIYNIKNMSSLEKLISDFDIPIEINVKKQKKLFL